MNSAVFPPIPSDTAKVARAVFGRSNFYLATGDQANQLFSGLVLDHALRVKWAVGALARLYLITIFQYMETLPDHLAKEALRKRVDWKYALHLPLSYSGLEDWSFCQFRRELLAEPIHQQNLQALLSRFSEALELDVNGRFSQDPYQVISGVCLVSRVAKIWETINQVLEALATRQPEWLISISLPHWYERYSHPSRSLNLGTEQSQQEAVAQAIGADGYYLLKAISEADVPELAHLPEVSTLERVWQEQYEYDQGKMSWRKEACAGCLPINEILCR